MTVKATNQIDLIDLTDGYTINLSSDAHTFIGTETSVNGTQSISTQVSAYRGNTAIGCTIGTMTGAEGAALPAGITAVATSGTEPIITITATSSLTSGGVINIPVQVNDSITIHKVFSYSIAFKGADGADGQDGVDGTSVTITTTEVTYQTSSSGTTAPTGSWSSTIPSVPANQFLWTKTYVKYSDNKSTTSYSVSRSPKDGTAGTSVTITTTETSYKVDSQGTTPPSTGWSAPNPTTIPEAPAGQYLWTKTHVLYSDNKTTTSYSVARSARDGEKGDSGEDALLLMIESTNGTIFKNTQIATTLSAHVYKGPLEVTGAALTALGTIKWYKDGGATAVKTGPTLTIAAGDITNKASYTAKLEA